MSKTISIVVPAHNEAASAPLLHARLAVTMAKLPDFGWELIFVNDGSADGTDRVLRELADQDSRVKFIEFSRNFGKEAATSAGLLAASGDAVMMMDGDLQHPPELIPEFIAKWAAGADVVIGVRRRDRGKSLIRTAMSGLYYRIMRAFSDTPLIPNATDYRLLDRRVVAAFARFTERDRLTRGLINWMGFRQDFVNFDAEPRRHGQAAYGFNKLFHLAVSSLVAHSFLPLRIVGYLGLAITSFFGLFGLAIVFGKYVFALPFFVSFSGTAQLAILILFLVGIILSSLGLIALYIQTIQREALNRPLYIVRDSNIPDRDSAAGR